MYEMYYQTQSQLEDLIQSTNLMPPVVLGFFVWVIPHTHNPTTSPWVRWAAIAVPFLLVCPLVTHDSVCAVGGFGPSAQLTRGVMIKMVGIILSEGVERRLEEKVTVSTLMLFFIRWVCSHAAVCWQFHLCSAQVSPVLLCLHCVLLVTP